MAPNHDVQVERRFKPRDTTVEDPSDSSAVQERSIDNEVIAVDVDQHPHRWPKWKKRITVALVAYCEWLT
jgi:hypothetical protein